MSEQIMQDIILEEQEIQELELNANHWYSINH
jgi:hypothetical protein